MKVISLEQKYCERTLKYLDAYIDNELLVETSQELLRHLEGCRACADALQIRLHVKARLRHAVKEEATPAKLGARIHSAILAESQPRRNRIPWTRWSMAAAAVLVAWLGGLASPYLLKLSRTSKLNPGLTLSEQSASILRVGIGDHIHCVVESHFDQHHMTPQEIARKMGRDYAGLVPLLKEKLPERFILSSGHRCHAIGREFVHVILKHENQTISLTITEKQGLSFPRSKRVNSLMAEDILLHQDRLDSVEAVGFETKNHLAFVVSALDHTENFQIAAVLAGPVSGFLNKL